MNKKVLLFLLILLFFLSSFLILRGIELSHPEAGTASSTNSPAVTAPTTDSTDADRISQNEVNIFLNNSGN